MLNGLNSYRKIYEVTKGEAIIATGVGQNQMWAAQHYWYDKPNSLLTSGGLGTMGFGLPAAMGAKMGCPDRPVWVIDGDGSFQMTIQELATIVQDNIAVKIAILNNEHLGMKF
jgi:acetolactate synthase-1/2/3 large subunit